MRDRWWFGSMTKEKDRLREPSFFSAFPGALIDFSPRSARILQRATCFRGWIESKGTERGRKRQPSFRLFFLFFSFSLSLSSSLFALSERKCEPTSNFVFPRPATLSLPSTSPPSSNSVDSPSWRLSFPPLPPLSSSSRDLSSHPHATMQGSLSGVPLARRAACAPSPSARGEFESEKRGIALLLC